MSVQEIKEQLKNGIENLSPMQARLAGKELTAYFDYLQSKKEMPKALQLSFAQFLELETSLKEEAQGKSIPAATIFKSLRKKYA
jgi:hypothetical protein